MEMLLLRHNDVEKISVVPNPMPFPPFEPILVEMIAGSIFREVVVCPECVNTARRVFIALTYLFRFFDLNFDLPTY